MKNWIKRKTMWVGFGVGLLGLMQTTFETAPIEPQYQGLITGGIGVAMMALRAVTTTSLADK